MKSRHFASRALPLAIACLLMAVDPAAAGDYSPKHLRAESFIPVGSPNFGPDWVKRNRGGPLPFDLRIKLAFAHPLQFGSSEVLLRLEATPKLREFVHFGLRF